MVKNFDMFTIVLTQFTNVTDTQTDRHTQTPHDGICRAYA